MNTNSTLTLADRRLMDLIWSAEEPMTAAQLCKVADEKLGWKRTTTYTVIKRLKSKGVLADDPASLMIPRLTREAIQQEDVQEVLDRSFNGSLPGFLAAFFQAGTVSDAEAAEIETMIEAYRRRSH